MSNERLLGSQTQITVSIPFGYDVPFDILRELMKHWTNSDDDCNWFDIPLPLSDTLREFLEQENQSK